MRRLKRLGPLPKGIDPATAPARFRAWVEQSIFQGRHLDAAGRAALATITTTEHAYFRALVDAACLLVEYGEPQSDPGLHQRVLTENLKWLDAATINRLYGAARYMMR